MAKGKAPGPDGLSVEFYTQCWPIVKNDFVKLLNQTYSTQSIDNRTKSGYITLIHKKGPKTEISNYRPISLLNYDLKIFTKCLTNRLKSLMTNLSHKNQYAKLGKQIFSIANLLRDLWWDASDSKLDAYFVSLDFKKAFDSIDQHWLSRVLHKMNFPAKFIRTINSLNKDANVRVLVNGFRLGKFLLTKASDKEIHLAVTCSYWRWNPLWRHYTMTGESKDSGKGASETPSALVMLMI